MPPVKRKAVTDERPSRSVKAAKVEKDGKLGGSTEKDSKRGRIEDAASDGRRPAAKSVLREEERAFPRGGASVLTPIEHKQIRAQADRDVLFEQQSGQRVREDQAEDDLFDSGAAVPAKKRKPKKLGRGTEKSEGSGIRIQGLSYKNLVIGSNVLGRVGAITSKDVALVLPNNLTGYVPFTAVSERLVRRIELLLEEDDRQANDTEDQDDDDIDLKQLFHEGQWLRATVTSTAADSADSKSKRHIELSVDPRSVNGGLSADNVVTNSVLQASVQSVEDHGIIMDLGLSGADGKGFISKKDLGAGFKLETLQEGQVMLCLVTGKGSDGKVLKLSPDAARFSAVAGGKLARLVSEASTVDAFLPGTAVDVLITEASSGGLVGKVMGMLDVTADVVHSSVGGREEDLVKKYKIGSKVTARIIWTLPSDLSSRRIGVSLLEHMLVLPPTSANLPENATPKFRSQASGLSQGLPSSSIVEDVKVAQVLPERGLFLTLPSAPGAASGAPLAFAHISQISDSRIDSLSSTTGSYKVDSAHRARIISYNPLDNLYYVSLKNSVLDQAFLRLEDLTIGAIVKGTVDRLILGGKQGITGVLVKLSESLTGLVPEMHLSDVQLQYPERKFREGFPVKARVLSVDTEKRHLRLTLKKTLVNDDELPIWKEYESLQPGMDSKGTIVNLLPTGGAVQFFGDVRAWLPVAEMSDAFIERPDKHFRLGQTVTVRIVSVDAKTQEMKVSCRIGADLDSEQQDAWAATVGGQIVSGTVTEKSVDSISVDLENGLKGLIRVGQLADGSASKGETAVKRIRVGQKLTELVVLNRLERSRQISLTSKPRMVQDAKAGTLVTSLTRVKQGAKVHGFIRNVTSDGVFVEFANETVSLIPKSQLAAENLGQPDFGLRKDQTITAFVFSVDAAHERFTLSTREQQDLRPAASSEQASVIAANVSNAVDASITSFSDFTLGKVTKARIASVKATQINVRLADNVQGRIDVSEAFDSWDGIAHKKKPLQCFKRNAIVDVRILGIHDARNHRFLPISHRENRNPVFELSAKKSRIRDGDNSLFDLGDVKAGSTYLAFVNKHKTDCAWVNLSPNVRGRVALLELSDDVSQINHVEKNFPVGCALRVKVKAIDVPANRLDLTARSSESNEPLTLQSLSPGMVLPARVTKVTERSVTVQLSDSIAAPVSLVEMTDDYEQVAATQYSKNDIVRVCILNVDAPNKRLFLSLRPSKVLSSSLQVKDPQITSVSQLKSGDLVRGFVKHVGDKGVIVSLGARVDAFVRITDLSDQYIKDWKSIVEVDQLVKGRMVSVDANSGYVQLSLKASQVDAAYKPPLTINDLELDMVVTGKVRKVEDFGAFIDIDNTQPRLSGLCHRSEIAAKRVEDVRKLYSEGDVVKAKVLSVDVESRKISLGLKASYFTVDLDEEMEDDSDEEVQPGGVDLGMENEDEDIKVDGGTNLDNVEDMESDVEQSSGMADEIDGDSEQQEKPLSGLKTTGFDWTGETVNPAGNGAVSDSEPDTSVSKKRKRSKPDIKADLTGDLDKYGPRSVSDFERRLLGQPNDSGLWIQFMAFQLQLSEVQKAREIAERALRTIHIRELEEKADVWIAWLNLEVEYGGDDRVEEVFKQACQVQDPLEMHEKLASIYIDSGKRDKADAIFERIVANKAFRASPDAWFNYATFLMTTLTAPTRARSLLSRALQSIPESEHRALTSRFAALEFRSPQGDIERGRTIFENLVSNWPKWSSGWDQFSDLERSRIAHANLKAEKDDARRTVRSLYERMVAQKMKKRRARFVFKKWLEFEEQEGDAKGVERVKGLAREYVEGLQFKAGDVMEE